MDSKFVMVIIKAYQRNAVCEFFLSSIGMIEKKIPIDAVHITELLRNPVLVRIVSILGIASLSILELLEYNLERRMISCALSEGVIAIDEPTLSSSQFHKTEMMQENNILLRGDSYFCNFLSSCCQKGTWRYKWSNTI
jgi:hypothetical protein